MKRLLFIFFFGGILISFALTVPNQAWGATVHSGNRLLPAKLNAPLPINRPVSPSTPHDGANFTVNVSDDPGAPICLPESCSLRAAIIAANENSLTDTQTIDFDLIYPLTITLSSPLPVITGTVVISGPGSTDIMVNGDGLYRVFEVGNGASLTMSGMTIRNGYMADSGAGIFNDHGALSLSECAVTDNSTVNLGGAGIFNDFGAVQLDSCVVSNNSAGTGDGGGLRNNGGFVTVVDTTFVNNHAFHNGAIDNSGVMSLTGSLVADNQARVAGGIYNSGVLTVTNSTLSGNIAYIASGGAIDNGGTLVVANSTFYENGADLGADIDNSNGSAHITNSTIYSTTSPSTNSINNGGISATLTLSNTILAAPIGITNCANLSGSSLLVSADNLATDNTCAEATVVLPDQLKLGVLQDNGGPTPTIAIPTNSVAINAGDDLTCAASIGAPMFGAGSADQRGVSRPQGEHCDVGAFEQTLLLTTFLPIILAP
jgi:hypothetical protein